MIVLKIWGDSLGNALPFDGEWVRSMDFEAHGGRGHVVTTKDLAEALKFDDHGAAFAFWKTSPKCHPVRLTDGEPNRPLTAYNVVMEQVP